MKRGTQWPFLIGGLLALNVGANAALYVAGNSDRSFAVEKDYDLKARDFERELAQRQLNADLGWNVAFELRDAAARAEVTLTARLEDRLRRNVEGAACAVEAFHNARAGERQQRRLSADGAGALRTTLTIARAGIWEFSFTCDTRGVRFTQTARRELAVAAVSAEPGGATP